MPSIAWNPPFSQCHGACTLLLVQKSRNVSPSRRISFWQYLLSRHLTKTLPKWQRVALKNLKGGLLTISILAHHQLLSHRIAQYIPSSLIITQRVAHQYPEVSIIAHPALPCSAPWHPLFTQHWSVRVCVYAVPGIIPCDQRRPTRIARQLDAYRDSAKWPRLLAAHSMHMGGFTYPSRLNSTALQMMRKMTYTTRRNTPSFLVSSQWLRWMV